MIVAVGRSDEYALYAAFHVTVLLVPLSLKRMIRRCPSVGVPDGAAIVRFAACAVRATTSKASESGVRVAVEAEDDTRGVMRLFVSV